MFLAASILSDRRAHRWWPLAYAVGAAASLSGLLLWAVFANLPLSGISYALFGFRVDALHTLGGAQGPLLSRLGGLALPTVGSGLALILVLGVAGLRRSSLDHVMRATLVA